MSLSKAEIIKELQYVQTQDHFSGDGFLYTGIQNNEQKTVLNQQVAGTAQAFIDLYQTSIQPTQKQLLEILSQRINLIDPDQLDTEDREHVAEAFEQFLDIIGLESSEGILNTWLYNEEINQLIEKNNISD